MMSIARGVGMARVLVMMTMTVSVSDDYLGNVCEGP